MLDDIRLTIRGIDLSSRMLALLTNFLPRSKSCPHRGDAPRDMDDTFRLRFFTPRSHVQLMAFWVVITPLPLSLSSRAAVVAFTFALFGVGDDLRQASRGTSSH